MSTPLEDYALIGDMETAALVSRTGSIDWLCLPRFDSAACFAELLGTKDHGHWRIGPRGAGEATEPMPATRRSYRKDTLILESEWDTPEGTVRVIDFMPPRDEQPDVVRIVEGVSGQVSMRSVLRLRFDYGAVTPWVRHTDGQIAAIAGPDAVSLHCEVPTYGEDYATYADFTISAGERVRFVLTWHPSHKPPPPSQGDRLEETERFWTEWLAGCTYEGEWAEPVRRSLITLKALTYDPTGGIVAAATTSVPEDLGGVRNWDYRYCWLRDATMTLGALMRSGFIEEASEWREWLLRAIAGTPRAVQIMYGLGGERRLPEAVIDWLPGYENSAPVRVGNGAVGQFQLDVYGEVMDALAIGRELGLEFDADAWEIQKVLLDHLLSVWREPDEGIWEVRGPRRHFTYSKVMAWVAFDRAVQAVERHGRSGDVEQWRAARNEIHAEVIAKAYDSARNTFTMAYDSPGLDAALLLMPQVGFLPPTDPRMVGTVEAVQRELTQDGLIMRYDVRTGSSASDNHDGLPGSEGTFLACSFWLADDLHAIGRTKEARDLFARLLAIQNDVGLLAEEFDPRYGRMVGNFPQAYSHIALINSALHLSGEVPVVRPTVELPLDYG